MCPLQGGCRGRQGERCNCGQLPLDGSRSPGVVPGARTGRVSRPAVPSCHFMSFIVSYLIGQHYRVLQNDNLSPDPRAEKHQSRERML